MGQRARYFQQVAVWVCVMATTIAPSPGDHQEDGAVMEELAGDVSVEGSVEVRSDPGEDAGASPCPASCFCEEEAGYATCVGDGQWAPPTLPAGLTRVELRGFLVPELGAAQLHHLPGLRELQLNQCNLSRLYNDAFAAMAELDRLDLSENRLGVLGPDSFRGLRSLRHLDLSANRLANLTQPFTHLPTLQHLNLRDNALVSLTQDTFQGLDRVQYVNLDANKIVWVEVAAFQHLTSLAHLILSNNPLATLATLDFFGSRLQYIDVSNIGISRVPQALTQFVRDLRLAKNSIREIHRGDLDSYPYLGLLVLDDNALEVLEEDALGRHEYLARLWLNGNKLKTIPLSLPPALRAVYIEENLITALHEGDFRVQSNLEQLFLQRNHIAAIAPCALCELTSLKTLDLQANRLTNLTGRVFSRLASLETLDLSQNPILTLEADVMAGLTSVRVLQMSRIHSLSVHIPDTLFDPLKGLQVLEMYGSPQVVAKLVNTTRTLHSLRGIRELNIMHNDLSALRPDFPAFFPKLQVAKLSGNTWDCGSQARVMWMKRWMTHSPVHFYRSYSIRCSTPVTFGYKPVMLLEENDFPATTAPVPVTSSKMSTTTNDVSATTSVTTTTVHATTHSIDNTTTASSQDGEDATSALLIYEAENVNDSFSAVVNGSTLWVNDMVNESTVVSENVAAGVEMLRQDENTSVISTVTFHPDGDLSTTPALGDFTRSEQSTTAVVTAAGLGHLTAIDRNTVGTAATVSPSHSAATVTVGLTPTVTSTAPGTPTAPAATSQALPYWILHNRMLPQNTTLTKRINYFPNSTSQPVKIIADRKSHETKRIKKVLKKAKMIQITADRPRRPLLSAHRMAEGHRAGTMDLNKDLWLYRGDNSHGLSPGQPLPVGVGHGRVSDGAVVGAGIVASCVGVALLVGGFLLARGRGKAGPIWEASSYWREGSDEDVVMAVGETGTAGMVTETEGTVGLVTETHRGLNNRLYLLLQRDSATGITPDTLPDPRAHSSAPDWH
ncbi:uncharacterized protein [Procambarus clarkii]|uniref:uncharacterized protein n=1 Tax=Procambarus clarkii TaxID=6728 RepID=UPI003742C9EA